MLWNISKDKINGKHPGRRPKASDGVGVGDVSGSGREMVWNSCGLGRGRGKRRRREVLNPKQDRCARMLHHMHAHSPRHHHRHHPAAPARPGRPQNIKTTLTSARYHHPLMHILSGAPQLWSISGGATFYSLNGCSKDTG